MKKYCILLSYILLTVGFFSCSSSGLSEEERVDSIRRADSIAKEIAWRLEEARIDSIRQDSIKQFKEALSQFSPQKKKYIFINKPSYRLYLMEEDKVLLSFPVCLGKGIGQKKRAGDHKTPEGEFKVNAIQDATYFPYNFHDGRGVVYGTYGPWFFRLNTPQSTHIGIHGTIAPESMGKRESDGCIRLRNEDIEQLKPHVYMGMNVLISPDIIER